MVTMRTPRIPRKPSEGKSALTLKREAEDARILQERKERDEADRPFCDGARLRRPCGQGWAGEISDLTHVLPAAQVENLQRIGAAYGHFWALHRNHIGKHGAMSHNEAIAYHLISADKNRIGNAPPIARDPTGEVWGYARDVLWRVMSDGRTMIWLYGRYSGYIYAPDIRISHADAIFELAGKRRKCVKGKPEKAGVENTALRLWNASPLLAVYGPMDLECTPGPSRSPGIRARVRRSLDRAQGKNKLHDL